MDLLNKSCDTHKEHTYVTLTEHKGDDFHLLERYLAVWQDGGNPLLITVAAPSFKAC